MRAPRLAVLAALLSAAPARGAGGRVEAVPAESGAASRAKAPAPIPPVGRVAALTPAPSSIGAGLLSPPAAAAEALPAPLAAATPSAAPLPLPEPSVASPGVSASVEAASDAAAASNGDVEAARRLKARALVEQADGWSARRPEPGGYAESPVSDGRRLERRGEDGAALGFMEYGIDAQGVLRIGEAESFRRREGVYEGLLREILARHPGVERISTALTRDNKRIYFERLEAGATPLEALRATPAYEIRRRLGFSEIDVENSNLKTERYAGAPLAFDVVRPLAADRRLGAEERALRALSTEGFRERYVRPNFGTLTLEAVRELGDAASYPERRSAALRRAGLAAAAPRDGDADPPPRRRAELLALISNAGATASVHRARLGGREVAVKVFRAKGNRAARPAGKDETDMIAREVDLAARLSAAVPPGWAPLPLGEVTTGRGDGYALELFDGKDFSGLTVREAAVMLTPAALSQLRDALLAVDRAGLRDKDDPQFAILSSDQELGGVRRSRGEVILFDAGMLKEAAPGSGRRTWVRRWLSIAVRYAACARELAARGEALEERLFDEQGGAFVRLGKERRVAVALESQREADRLLADAP